MKTSLIKHVLGSVVVLAFLSIATPSRAEVIYSFQGNSTFDYTYGTWNGNVLPGPTFLSIDGTATDNGGGVHLFPGSLDLSSYAATGKLQIEAKLLAGNAATGFYVNLFTSNSTYTVYQFSTAGLNDATFTLLSLNLASPSIEVGGGVTNWTSITKFELQGNYASGAALDLGVRNLEVVTTPEPGTWPIVILGGFVWLGVRRFRAKA